MAVLIKATIIGYTAATLFFFLWLNVRDDLASEIDRCNTDKMVSIAAAEKVVRKAEQGAAKRRINQLTEQARIANHAREIAEEAAREAESRPVQVRTVIRRVASEDSCINADVHPDLVKCLRDGTNCREAGSG